MFVDVSGCVAHRKFYSVYVVVGCGIAVAHRKFYSEVEHSTQFYRIKSEGGWGRPPPHR